MFAVIDDERRADGLATLRAAGATGQERHRKLAADIECGAHVGVAPRNQHADRLDLINRSVGRVAAARCAIEQDLARHGTAQSPDEVAMGACGSIHERLGFGRVH